MEQSFFFLTESASCFECGFFLGLGALYLVDGAFDGCVTTVEYLSGFFLGLGQNFATFIAQLFGVFLILCEAAFYFFLFLANGHSLVFPVALVAGDVE